jgi:hypothetical protein
MSILIGHLSAADRRKRQRRSLGVGEIGSEQVDGHDYEIELLGTFFVG